VVLTVLGVVLVAVGVYILTIDKSPAWLKQAAQTDPRDVFFGRGGSRLLRGGSMIAIGAVLLINQLLS
jgi:hypothetical protein